MWVVGVLTWNDPATCHRTLDALEAGLSGHTAVTVLDNGSDVPFTHPTADVVREPVNRGAGGGVTALVRHLLRQPFTHLLFLEDDWMLERPLNLAELEPHVEPADIGQMRLGVRDTVPPQRYYTYGLKGAEAEEAATYADRPLLPYGGGQYQRIRSLWSNNPFVCRRDMAERFLLTGLDEKRMAMPYYRSGLTTLSTTPGHFRHLGTIRDRREKAGWKK